MTDSGQLAELRRQLEARTAELRQAEEQIRLLQKLDAVGRLAGGVAHDFNNMLGAITMYCDLALDDAENPADVRDSIAQIRQVAERGATLTRQLLIFGRKQISRPETIGPNSLIAQLAALLSRTLGERIEIVSRLAPDLREVRIDPAQLEQALMNLALNARDAMPQGGKIVIETANARLDAKLDAAPLELVAGDYVRIRVTDTGVGMDAATRARAFEPFFTTQPFGKGVGLGLTTAYGIVRQGGGAIRVESEPGRGSTFEIYLPAAPAGVPEPGTKPEPDPGAAASEARTILLTEDNEGLRLVFFKMLRRHGYEVLIARNGEEALEICRRHEGEIPLLLTDIVMPGMSGTELAREARVLRPKMLILYMSGYADDALDDIAHELIHPVQLIQKPFSTRELIEKIRSVLRGP